LVWDQQGKNDAERKEVGDFDDLFLW